ncbi:leucine-rich repeat domain-containing protein [Herbidospora galbida]|uniref:Leucine-rich repeat domain-containing protein n=1 Tax=Herbidospora galbida TaxID=2575442 RepID=A0A4U3MLC4_9ACTN|nr:STM4015 family protein [Herbidospora galbida]TKK89344.1 leucine-rich repeat domain-containing protein [Herbidospora galbida]
MTISLDLPRHTDETDVYYGRYAGLPTVDFSGAFDHPPGEAAWSVDDSSLAGFVEAAEAAQVRALVLFGWDETPHLVVEKLVAGAHRLPALRAIFFGAIPQEAQEMSWINQTDVTPLLTAFPDLERLETRGSMGLRLSPVRHERLRMLRIESGGLGGEVVRGVAACHLPALEHLELWLGVDEYGGDYTVEDLAPILTGDRLPALKHLGLQDSDRQDDVAAAVATAPIVARLDGLALSMGTLTDEGAEALLSGQPLTHLRRLDLHHHYLSDAMTARLRAALPTVDLDLDSQLDPDEDEGWLYTSVSE